MSPAGSYIALLRGVNVGGRNMVPMAGLRELCTGLGWADVRTYVQSGNVVFRAAAAARTLETQLERALVRQFELSVAVIVRSAADWQSYVDANPFEAESQREPNLVMLALAKRRPDADAVALLEARATGERIARTGDALWIHYANGAGRSKLTPGLLDRSVGSPVTTRNWRTVLKLRELAAA